MMAGHRVTTATGPYLSDQNLKRVPVAPMATLTGATLFVFVFASPAETVCYRSRTLRVGDASGSLFRPPIPECVAPLYFD